MDASLRIALTAALALGLGAPAMAAGSVEVKFSEPTKFTDVGVGAFEIERNTEALEGHLKKLGAQLPDGQTLRIDVLDVDLAGKPPYGPSQLRVMGSGADWPRIKLHYALVGGDGHELRSGDETVADQTYLSKRPRTRPGELLPYEARMLSDWFEKTFIKTP